MRGRFLRWVDLTTGQRFNVRREEVPDGDVEGMRPMIAGAVHLAKEVSVAPSVWMTGRAEGRGLIVSLWRLGDACLGMKIPLAHLTVAASSRVGARMWRDLDGDFDHRPADPWCAAYILPPEPGGPSALWLTSVGRAVAWAWVEWRGK